jgi:hypothetical protein
LAKKDGRDPPKTSCRLLLTQPRLLCTRFAATRTGMLLPLLLDNKGSNADELCSVDRH